MKFFMIEGTILDAGKMNEEIMKIHMTYTQKAMDGGMILLSGLKEDMSGGIFIMKSDSIEEIEEYLSNEPFKRNGIQDYSVTEFQAHYMNQSLDGWMK